MSDFEQVPGGVCVPQGFVASGVSAGLKESGGPDLALIVSEQPAAAAGVFTRNRVVAAPVLISRAALRSGSARGVVVNAGCANACTGASGLADAGTMAVAAAAAVNVEADQMLVCSTGKIGSHLPMDRVLDGITRAGADLKRNDELPARAIMTTDTVPKLSAWRHSSGWSVGGIAKGAGMISPDMATTLGFVTTDALVEAQSLRVMLKKAADASFNAITVDGETSTNDTLLVFANGASGIEPDPDQLQAALTQVCRSLSRQVVLDGEGATKLVVVRITGAKDRFEAGDAARAVANSLLVKTALYGRDANWGRVASAVGAAGVEGNFDALNISMGGVVLLKDGVPAGDAAEAEARKALAAAEVVVECDLGAGSKSAEVLTTDLTEEYVRINAEYEL